MGMWTSGDIFQAKFDKIFGDIKGVKTYINDIIVLNKDSYENHMDQLRIIFGRLRAAGLNVNAPKWKIWAKGNSLPMLCYDKGSY